MSKKNLLFLQNLNVSIDGKEILHDIHLSVGTGEVHAIMGPNGSGKSTLLYALMGHPAYAVGSLHQKNKHQMLFNNEDIASFSTEERAKKGLFLALQSPIPIPGVSVVQIIRASLTERVNGGKDGSRKTKTRFNPLFAGKQTIAGQSIMEFSKSIQAAAMKLNIGKELLNRGIHDGFSGGERKKIEILEALLLKPKLALFDEIDTGLDVDALQTVAKGINELKNNNTSILLVTHYQRILQFIVPDRVHVLAQGRIIASGGTNLAKTIDKKGYASYVKSVSAE